MNSRSNNLTEEERKVLELKLKEPIRIILTHADAVYLVLGVEPNSSMIDELQDQNLGRRGFQEKWEWNRAALSFLSTPTLYELYRACRASFEQKRPDPAEQPKKSSIVLPFSVIPPLVNLNGIAITKPKKKRR